MMSDLEPPAPLRDPAASAPAADAPAADAPPAGAATPAADAAPCPLRPEALPEEAVRGIAEGRLGGGAGAAPSEGLPCWSPYGVGVGLGLTLLLAYGTLGTGLGTSGALERLGSWGASWVCPQHVAEAVGWDAWAHPQGLSAFRHHVVAMALGTALGGLLSALASRRLAPSLERGPRLAAGPRLILALFGGILVGFASRLGGGSTGSQILSGMPFLLTGSALVLVGGILGGFTLAFVARRLWR